MPRHRTHLALAALGMLALSGCVAYPVDGYYAEPAQAYVAAPAYVAPPTVYFGGTFGGYRPYYGPRNWGHRHWR